MVQQSNNDLGTPTQPRTWLRAGQMISFFLQVLQAGQPDRALLPCSYESIPGPKDRTLRRMGRAALRSWRRADTRDVDLWQLLVAAVVTTIQHNANPLLLTYVSLPGDTNALFADFRHHPLLARTAGALDCRLERRLQSCRTFLYSFNSSSTAPELVHCLSAYGQKSPAIFICKVRSVATIISKELPSCASQRTASMMLSYCDCERRKLVGSALWLLLQREDSRGRYYLRSLETASVDLSDISLYGPLQRSGHLSHACLSLRNGRRTR
jgi:hypothetical protein